MPVRHYLNAIRSVQGGLPKPKHGTWESDPQFLARYVTSVNVGDVQLSSDNLAHSVPSVFQRPIQFHHALNEPDNPLHLAVLGEWRGLMAFICLSDWLNLTLNVATYTVPAVGRDEQSHVGNENMGDLHFRAALRFQLPRRLINGTGSQNGSGEPQRVSDFEQWDMIYCNEALLGATSPWSLLYTAAQSALPPAIPWQENGVLIDPIKHFDPGRTGRPVKELAILHAWVDKRLEEQSRWDVPQGLGAFTSALAGYLGAWKTELEAYADPAIVLDGLESCGFSAGLPASILKTPFQFNTDDSDIAIDTKQGRILLFHKNLAPDVRVYRGVRANRIDMASLPDEGTEFHTRDGFLIRQPFIVAERFLFSKKVLRLDLSEHAFAPQKITTPIQPRFFRYFGYDQLDDLKMLDKSGVCMAALTLRLMNGQRVELTHVYRDNDMPNAKTGSPALALWPSGYDPEWKQHFAAYAAAPSDLLVKPIFGNDAQVQKESDGHAPSTEEKQVRIWSLSQPAIGFALRLWEEDRSQSDCGVVLRSRPQALQTVALTRKWRIAVDFGTSSTTVMVDKGDGTPVPLELPSSVLALIEPGKTQGTQDEISRSLYPQDDVHSPFQTLLYELGETATVWQGQQTQAGVGSSYVIRFASNIKQDIKNEPIANLKWGMGNQWNGNPLNAYLSALVRFIVWSARSAGVGAIEFSWSYPTSLTPGPLGEMSNFWSNLHNNGNQWRNGLSVTVSGCMSEAEASCRAITAMSGAPTTTGLAITVDIGGGSTDIAFWNQNRMLNQISFNVAGNDIFDRRYLQGDVLGKFLEFCTGELPEKEECSTAGNRSDVYINGALVDARAGAVNAPSQHPVPVKMFGIGVEKTEPWIRFRTLGYVFFSALCYYIGVKARSIQNTDPHIVVIFGGRGSSMLSWLHANSTLVANSLQSAIQAGLNRLADDEVRVNFPRDLATEIDIHSLALAHEQDSLPALKTEVASGMLRQIVVTTDVEKIESVTADEVGWSLAENPTGSSLKWTEEISRASLSGIRPPRGGSESTIFGTFVSDFLRPKQNKTLESLGLDKDRLAKLTVAGHEVAADIGMAAANNQALQPIFAFELKTLMKKYAGMA